MKIAAKIVHRYDCSRNVRVAIEMAADSAIGAIGDFLTSAEFAGWFIDELDRLNAVDDAARRGDPSFLNQINAAREALT